MNEKPLSNIVSGLGRIYLRSRVMHAMGDVREVNLCNCLVFMASRSMLDHTRQLVTNIGPSIEADSLDSLSNDESIMYNYLLINRLMTIII